MSDDLVKRLRNHIEELEAKLATCEKYRDAYAEMGRIGTESYRDLEAKLAMAVEALEKIAQHDMQYWAIITLAELKGETDE